jgi:hypothetical protein
MNFFVVPWPPFKRLRRPFSSVDEIDERGVSFSLFHQNIFQAEGIIYPSALKRSRIIETETVQARLDDIKT